MGCWQSTFDDMDSKKRLTPQFLSLKSRCAHLDGTGGENVAGSLALVAIGNPLIESDCAALELLAKFQNKQSAREACIFSFDGNFYNLQSVFKNHNGVIILDSVQSTSSDKTVLIIPLTEDVLSKSGFAVRASHGLSWLDEIKFRAISAPLPNSLVFFGVPPHLSRSNLEEAIVELESLIHDIAVQTAQRNDSRA